jgi:hypothetical protein
VIKATVSGRGLQIAECGMPNEAIEVIGTDGLCLRVQFLWRHDRFGNVISVVNAGGESIALLESVEGTPEDHWPPSPPLQSLSIETLSDGRRAALLLGMAGGSHWSASVEPSSGEAALTFDLACRSARQPGILGSRYRRIANGERLVISGVDVTVTEQSDAVEIQPLAASGSSGTIRWKYVVRCTEH